MYYLTRCHIVYLATLNMSNQHPSRFPKESLAWVVGIFVWEAFPIRTHRVHSYPLVERLPFVLNNRLGIRSQGYTDHSMRQRGTDARKKPTTANCMNEEGFPPSLPAHSHPRLFISGQCWQKSQSCGMLNGSGGLPHPHTALPQEAAQQVNKSLQKLYVKVWRLADTFYFFQNSPKEALM